MSITIPDSREIGFTYGLTAGMARIGRWCATSLIPSGIETVGFSLFFLMLFVPTAYRPIKAALLMLLLLALVVRILIERRAALHPRVAFGCLLFSVLGTLFVLRGYLAGAPGALRMSTVYVIWPFINALLITGLADQARLWRLACLCAWITIAICLYCATYVLWSAGWWPDALYLELDVRPNIGFYDGAIEVSLTSLSSLLFLVPFVAGALLAWPRTARIPRVWLWMALVLGLLTGLLSGRRALQLVLGIAAPLALIFWRLLPHDLRRARGASVKRSLVGAAIATVVVVIALKSLYGVQPGAVWATFKTGFEFSADPVAHSRATQFDALIDGWLTSPFLGSGHGAAAPGNIRSPTMPWAYELAYLALLYHTGIVGFILYALGVAWIYVEGIRVIRKGTALAPLMVSVLTGTSTFLLANATNPYLEKFDCIWTLFLPIAIVNVSLLERGKGLGS